MTPELLARQHIDAQLSRSGWVVQDHKRMNLAAARGVAVREFPTDAGPADYLLFVDKRPVGVLEAKPEGTNLITVEAQTGAYATALPDWLKAPVRPLPFLYESTGTETQFTNRLDPVPRSRRVFAVHRPETLAEGIRDAMRVNPVHDEPDHRAATLPGRLPLAPSLPTASLWPAQERAVRNLEASLAKGRRRALIQMATGAGKTYTAITAIYRLIKHGGARRVLFLVDRANLGRQALKEFQAYLSPERPDLHFHQEFGVLLATSDTLSDHNRVVISTIQRLYTILTDGPPLPVVAEEGSLFDSANPLHTEPVPVQYSQKLPPDYFDLIVIDECHRSIYTIWSQVLSYFDAALIGLTATPSKLTYGFFERNVVSEYPHQRAVADRVNVPYEVYEIRTEITTQGSRVEVEPDLALAKRDRLTRKERWERLDDDLVYSAADLDRDVVAIDQIRTVLRTFHERLYTELFPGRREIPKTLIFAKSDDHAEDVLRLVREEFNLGNDGAVKITYKPEKAEAAKASPSRKAEDLIAAFRNSYNPRVAVTVDMIATGTDIKPLECLLFLRMVRSRALFEQMKGRGVRVINDADFQAVTPDAKRKTHFVIVDAVGVCVEEKSDAARLDRKRLPSFEKILQMVCAGNRDEAVIELLTRRLDRLERRLSPAALHAIAEAANGTTLREIVDGLFYALAPDVEDAKARVLFQVPPEADPTPAQLAEAGELLREEAIAPIAYNERLRKVLEEQKKASEVTIDHVSIDALLHAGFSEEAKRQAEALVQSFEAALRDHGAELHALEVFLSQPHGRRPSREQVKRLADLIALPPRSWTPDALWSAYAHLKEGRVKGSSAERTWVDLVALVRFALGADDELKPFRDQVLARFENWMAAQENRGKTFDAEQRQWLERIAAQIAVDTEVRVMDLDDVKFRKHGGLGRADALFGEALEGILDELNRELVA